MFANEERVRQPDFREVDGPAAISKRESSMSG